MFLTWLYYIFNMVHKGKFVYTEHKLFALISTQFEPYNLFSYFFNRKGQILNQPHIALSLLYIPIALTRKYTPKWAFFFFNGYI